MNGGIGRAWNALPSTVTTPVSVSTLMTEPFVAAADGMQVAVLTPTTLLAEQHFQTFSDRFADWPVRIAELSRFRTAKETKAALTGLADGSIDLVITGA